MLCAVLGRQRREEREGGGAAVLISKQEPNRRRVGKKNCFSMETGSVFIERLLASTGMVQRASAYCCQCWGA